MEKEKTDPRVLRTRKLIMDSFIELSSKKEFKDITIKDITTEAMINRATFYYHFQDIYDLLEKALSEVLSINLNYEQYKQSEISEASLTSMFKAVTEFQQSLSSRCHRGYEDTIARIIREQLEVILYKLLLKQQRQNGLKDSAEVKQQESQHVSKEETESLQIMAIMLSWGIYGASVEWRRSSKLTPEQYFKNVVPLIMNGIC